MMLRRPVEGKAAGELAREAPCVKPPVPLRFSPVPNHAVTRALGRAFRASWPCASRILDRGLELLFRLRA
jgi:hypothetical protein